MDDFSLFNCLIIELSYIFFLLIEFHCSYSIYYKIVPYYVYYYCILPSMQGVVDGLYESVTLVIHPQLRGVATPGGR